MVLILLVSGFVIANLITFLLMWYDKHCARTGKWRVSERVLFLSCACFGGIGGVLGMNLLRHKTKHRHFAFFFPLMMTIQIILFVLLISNLM